MPVLLCQGLNDEARMTNDANRICIARAGACRKSPEAGALESISVQALSLIRRSSFVNRHFLHAQH
jgi:hypothetical protein